MSDDPGPWHNDPAPPPSRARFVAWIAVLAAIAAGGWLLLRAFPERNFSGYDSAQLVYTFALLALVSTGVVLSRRFKLAESLRNIAIWGAVAVVVVLGYLYQDVFADIGTRLRGAVLPAEPQSIDANTVALSESEGGDYYAVGEVDGVRVRFAVDTGASDIVLSPQDAQRAGIDLAALDYDRETMTANGIGHTAHVTVNSLGIGPIRFSNVAVAVNQAPMDTSLLGMAFLRRLKSFEFRGHKLYLRRQ
jgi:aspartyl protease family protein